MLASVSVPFSSIPFFTVRDCPLPIVTSALSFAPSRVPPCITSSAPPVAGAIVPPLLVPPLASVNEPAEASKASVAPLLSSVPVILTVPSVPSKVPSPARVKVPPRSSLPPLLALSKPVLLQLAPLTVMVLPAVSA